MTFCDHHHQPQSFAQPPTAVGFATSAAVFSSTSAGGLWPVDDGTKRSSADGLDPSPSFPVEIT
jgi:hypothetical protein